MKKLHFLLLLLISGSLLSQQKIFQHKLDENTLQPQQKITAELASNYEKTEYFLQLPFNLNGELEITLPGGRIIKATNTNRYSYSNKTTSFVYSIQNEPYSDLVFSKFENVVTGMYMSQDGEKVMFHQTKDNIFAVSVVNQSKLDQQEKKDDFITVPAEELDKAFLINPDVCSPSTAICPATTIDVMILFTAEVKNIWGGLAQSNTNAATAITNFNISLANSGVTNTTINLVYSGEIAYTETGNISTDLSRLRSSTDGFLDEAHTLRATYGADLVSLVTSTPTNTCGLGYVNTNSTNYSNTLAFTVSLYNCAVSNLTIAHEMGHNMGLNHDWYVSTTTNPCSHHHGYVNQEAITLGTASPTNTRWRTIMAYTDQCSDAGINCPKINRWANPDLNWNGHPTGKPLTDLQPSHEVFGFMRFACVVSNFMPTVVLGAQESIYESGDVAIYPNPASEFVEVSVKGVKNPVFRVFNAVGQQVLTTKNSKFSVAHWTKGSYFISVYDDQNSLVASKKFLVK